MEEEFEHLWQKLKITEEEEEGVCISKEVFYEGSSWAPHCLLVSLLTRKSFNKEAFKGTMGKIWKSTSVRKITDAGENLFIFQFDSDEDREIIINTGPWNFDDRMVLTKPLEREDKPRRELLTKAALWVQVYGLPFVAMTENVGKMIGEKMGRLVEVKTEEGGMGLGGCLAIRVEIDVREKLMRRMRIAVEGGRMVFVDFKYERLPAFRYCCGVIGHNDSECVLALRRKKEGEGYVPQYGKWMRAPQRQQGNRETGGKGLRKGGGSQAKEMSGMEEGSGGDHGGSKIGREETRGKEKGNSGTKTLSSIGREKEQIGIEPPTASEKVHGKGENALTLAIPPQLRKEKGLMETDEMMRLDGEEGENPASAWVDGVYCSKLGRQRPKSPFGEVEHLAFGGHNRAQSAEAIFLGENKRNETGIIQNTWKRNNRVSDTMEEDQKSKISCRLGKRRAQNEGDEGKVDDERRTKRTKQGEIANNVEAEAGSQPHQDQ